MSSFFVFNDLRSEFIICFVDIGGIVARPSLFKLSFHDVIFLRNSMFNV